MDREPYRAILGVSNGIELGLKLTVTGQLLFIDESDGRVEFFIGGAIWRADQTSESAGYSNTGRVVQPLGNTTGKQGCVDRSKG